MARPTGPGWFPRNAKWLVPAGCASLLVVFGAFAAIVVSIVFGAMRSSDAWVLAMDRAKASRAVTGALGEPVEAGFFVSGSVSVSGRSGSADLAIPLRGPEGKGTLFVVATKSAGEWTFTRLELEESATKRRHDLLAAGP